jgi:uncharacterized membrane protein YoaK (UPF0700 family)
MLYRAALEAKMKDLEKTLETEREKLNSLVAEALRSSGFSAGAYASGAGSSILQGEAIQRQSRKVDRIIIRIYREGF